MLKAVVLLCVVASSLAGTIRVAKRMRHDRIVGGTAASIEEFPWQVSLQHLGFHHCGGSIIGSDWVLTAAQCVEGFDANVLSVRSGSSSTGVDGTISPVSVSYYHYEYNSDSMNCDIGVVQVSTPFVFSTTTNAVSLPDPDTDPAGGTTVTVAGWGYTETDGNRPVTLQQVTTSIIDRDECNELYSGVATVSRTMICAGNPSTTDGGVFCSGDTGGPLVSGGIQLGIVSWSTSFCESYPGVFTNVGFLRDYISLTTSI